MSDDTVLPFGFPAVCRKKVVLGTRPAVFRLLFFDGMLMVNTTAVTAYAIVPDLGARSPHQVPTNRLGVIPVNIGRAATAGAPWWRRVSVRTARAAPSPRPLEGDRAPVADDLRADFHQPIPQRCLRPVADRLGQHQGAQEVGQVVGQRVQLQPHGIGGEASSALPLDPGGATIR